MKTRILFFLCIAAALFLGYMGYQRGFPEHEGEFYGEFLIVVSGEGTNCVVKPLGEEIPEELMDAKGNVLPRNAAFPEDCKFQEGDIIEAYYDIPEEDSILEEAWETFSSGGLRPLIKEEALAWGEPLEITEAALLSEATPESLQEVWDFQYEHLLTEEAWEQYEADREEQLLNETPIAISPDVEWIEVIFYDSEEQRDYKFTESSDVAMIQGFLCCDTWSVLLDGQNGRTSSPISIYTEQDGVRYIIIPCSDAEGHLCFDVSALEEEGTQNRYYLAEGMRYETFLNNLNLMCQ